MAHEILGVAPGCPRFVGCVSMSHLVANINHEHEWTNVLFLEIDSAIGAHWVIVPSYQAVQASFFAEIVATGQDVRVSGF